MEALVVFYYSTSVPQEKENLRFERVSKTTCCDGYACIVVADDCYLKV